MHYLDVSLLKWTELKWSVMSGAVPSIRFHAGFASAFDRLYLFGGVSSDLSGYCFHICFFINVDLSSFVDLPMT